MATSADSAERRETSSMFSAMTVIWREADSIWSACCSAASASWAAVAWVSWADEDTCTEVSLMVPTSRRISSTVLLMASAMAPVKSSVTVALVVRSPFDSGSISSSRRMIACCCCWLVSFDFDSCTVCERKMLSSRNRMARIAAPEEAKVM